MHIFQYSIFQSFLYFIFPYDKKPSKWVEQRTKSHEIQVGLKSKHDYVQNSLFFSDGKSSKVP